MAMLKHIMIYFNIIIFLPFLSFAWGEENIWLNFVNYPNVANYIKCRDQIISSLSEMSSHNILLTDTATWKDLMESNTFAFAKLSRLIEEGNAYASRLGFLLHPFFKNSPADIEDLSITIGKLIKKNPELFLNLLHEYREILVGDLDGILARYNYENDDILGIIDRRTQKTKERIKALRGVDREEFKELRNECIKYLQDYIKELKSFKRKLQEKKLR